MLNDEYICRITESMKNMEIQLHKAAAADPEGMKEIAGRILNEIMPDNSECNIKRIL